MVCISFESIKELRIKNLKFQVTPVGWGDKRGDFTKIFLQND